MANNCSHTKYQVETQNENLLKLGESTLDTTSNFRLSGPSNLGIKIRTIDGTITYNGTSGKEATIIDDNFAVLQAGAKYGERNAKSKDRHSKSYMLLYEFSSSSSSETLMSGPFFLLSASAIPS